MEQGRAVFWAQLARFRTILDELSMAQNIGATLAEGIPLTYYYLPERIILRILYPLTYFIPRVMA